MTARLSDKGNVMKKSLALFAPLLLFCLLCLPSQARADAIAITSGSLSAGNFGPNGMFFSLAGQGLAITNSRMSGDGGGLRARACLPCSAGTLLNISSMFNGNLTLGNGPGTIGNTSYANLFYSGGLTFSGSVLLPNDGASSMILSAPFTFSGTLHTYLENPIIGSDPPIFTTLLSGQGIALIEFTSFVGTNGLRTFNFQNITYNFQPAPVPEPTTIFLLGTGLAGLAARARKRRRADKSTLCTDE